MDYGALLQGLIVSGFIGLAIGNFATNPIYRLPRNEPLFAKDPYCGDCNALLTPRDLFPVLSWLSTRGKCRYCGARVPAAYTVTEAAVGLVFVFCYLRYGFSETFILVSFGLTAFIMLAMMLHLDNFFSDKTLVACVVTGLLLRVMQERTLYGVEGTMFIAFLAGVIAWKISGKPLTRDAGTWPPYLKLLIASGAWLTTLKLCVLFTPAVCAAVLRKRIRWLPEYTLIAGTMYLIVTRI